MRLCLVSLLLFVAAGFPSEAQERYTLEGTIQPPGRASVNLWGSTTPFSADTLAMSNGQFRFRNLLAGTYTLSAFLPGMGEVRQTVVVGPSLADSRRRVRVTVEVRDASLNTDEVRRRGTVSLSELKIPDRARREYSEAQKRLGRRDIEGAREALRRAVEIAPNYSAAWNNLGTIAYQTRQYELAESHFREALKHDSSAFSPLVNLGGTLLSMGKTEEALKYNQHAVLMREKDALANSQLGMNYFALGDLNRGEKYLLAAIRLDPAHFSHPQLTLARLYLQQGKEGEALAQLEQFVKLHPDSQSTGWARSAIEKLRRE